MVVLHSTLTGADNHDPRGVMPDPLVLASNGGVVWQMEDDTGAALMQINTTEEYISFGNTTDDPVIIFDTASETRFAVGAMVVQLSDPPIAGAKAQLNAGRIYTKNVTSSVELFYRNPNGDVVQITSGTGLNGGGGSGGTLDAAYDFGGAHLGRQINIDSGFPVQLTAGASTDVALELTGSLSFSTLDLAIGGGTHGTPGGTTVIIGYNALAAGGSATSIGPAASAGGAYGIALGSSANASAARAIAIGRTAVATGSPSISIGASSSAGSNQITMGHTVYYYTEMLLGGGDADANARTLNLRTSNGSGSNVGGWGLNLSAGASTGDGNGGRVALRTAAAGASGSSTNPLFDGIYLDPSVSGATKTGEVGLASNIATDPRRYTSGAATATAGSGTISSIVDLSGHTNNASQIGWIKVELSVVADGTTNAATEYMVNSFVLDSAGALTLGVTERYASNTNPGTGVSFTSVALTTTSGAAIDIDWTTSGSDTFHFVYSVEWFFGPATTA